MARFWTSDQHLGHANVIRYCNRPFSSVEEMNEEIVRRHNTIVCPNDTVFHLGDFSLSMTAVETYLPRLNGTHYLIPGNHDRPHPAHSKKEPKRKTMIARYEAAGFVVMPIETKAIVADREVTMTHMPPSSDFPEERYTEFRPTAGGIILHGHVHNAWQTRGKCINVGVDVWNYAPVSEDELVKLIREIR